MNQLQAEALTVGIETALAAGYDRSRNFLLAVAGVNLLSHPIAWSLNGTVVPWLADEALVVVFEGLLLAYILRRHWAKMLLLSLILNSVTAGLGYCLFTLSS